MVGARQESIKAVHCDARLSQIWAFICNLQSVPGVECRTVAAAAGYLPGEAFFTKLRTAMTAAGTNTTSSMYRDLMEGRRVEVDQILGDLLKRGRSLEVKTTLIEAASVNLGIYQARLAAR
jgi:2-dehydropantoate 2-reductase